MREIFNGIEYHKYSVSQITAIHVLCMYIAMAELDGIDISKLRGTVQSDMFNAIQGCGALASDITRRGKGAVDYSVDICVDIIEFCTKYMPKWYPISIVGRNIREAGADAVSEIALAFSNGIAFIDKAVERGLDINEFGERLSFMFCCENDFFEEVAKFRAARRVWYKLMKEKGANNPLAMLVRMHKEAEATIDHDPELALAADRDMHQLLIDRCQNSRIAQILTDLYSLVQLFRAQQGKHIRTVRNLMEQRRRIIEALSQRDGELTEKLMREHIRTVQEGVMADINASSQTG